MKRLFIVALMWFGMASTASAGVPDPANCEVLPWDDYGDYGQAFMSPGTSSDSLADAVLIWVRDDQGHMCPGVHVEIDISACSNLCDDCPNGLNGFTNELGLVLLLPRVGGPEICDIKVWAGDVLIRTYSRVTSADWSISGPDTLADGAVLVNDVAFFVTHYPSPPRPYDWRHDYDADGVIGSSDSLMIGRCYLGENFYPCTSTILNCELSPRCLDFGTVMLGDSLTKEFIITNNGPSLLYGNVSETCDHYKIESGYDPYFLEPESSLVVTVLFKPESADTHTCLIETGDPICTDLFCTGVGWEPSSCGVEPTSLDFDSVGVGNAKDMTFTITNTGSGFLSGTVRETCGDYSIVSDSMYYLATYESLLVTVRFEPVAAGSSFCTIDTGDPLCNAVLCTGVGEAPVCEVIPTFLDFGTVYVGYAKDMTFAVTNQGGGILGGTVSETCGYYSIVSDSVYSLAKNESLLVTVRYEPSSVGTHNCTVETGGDCVNVSCSGVAFASSGQDIFVRTLGGSNNDHGVSIVQTSDGGFVVSGCTESFGEGNRDNILTKFDPFGNHIWTKVIGYGDNEGGIAVEEASDGGLVVFGWSESFWADREHWIGKFDATGNHIWSKIIRGDEHYWAYSGPVIEVSDGGFVVTGSTNNFGDADMDLILSKFDSAGSHQWTRRMEGSNSEMPGGLIETSDGGLVVAVSSRSYSVGDYDVLLLKFDSAGTLDWTKTVGGSNAELLGDLTETSDNGLVVAGYTESFGAGDRDVLLTKFNSAGALLWTKILSGSAEDGAYSVVELFDGTIVVTGWTKSYGGEDADLLLSKFDASGNHIRSRILGDDGDDRGYSLIQASDGRLVVSGIASYGSGNGDLLLASFTAAGITCIGQYVTPEVYDVSPDTTTPSPVIVTETPDIPSPTPTIVSAVPDTTVVCESPQTAVEEERTAAIPATLLYQNRPNPFNPDTQIPFALREDGHVVLEIFDVSGRHVRTLVDRRMTAGRYSESWDGRDTAGNQVASGIFFYRLKVGGKTFTRKCVLLK